MRKAWRTALAAAAALACLAAPAAAQVPREYAAQLAQQLARAEAAFRQIGFARAAGPFAGALAPGAVRALPVTLRAGQNYRILGVCDADCTDLDLRLLDGARNVTAIDAAPDDTPLLDATPRATGSFTIEVNMQQCDAALCYYAINVYTR